jgi:uncharacterized membrane protein YidH (DUF202 family)
MTEKQKTTKKQGTNKDVNYMAANRSLMAWVRTGLSLISFGFTRYKFLEYQREHLVSTRNVL